MADFKIALDELLTWEGYYSLDPNDPGGETYCGISRKNWPNWEGWSTIDTIKKDREDAGVDPPIKHNENLGLDIPVYDFYHHNYWFAADYSYLTDQTAANKVFQHNVNMGVEGIDLAQQTMHRLGISIIVDGKLGPATVYSINSFSTPSAVVHVNDFTYYNTAFLNEYVAVLEQHYKALVQAHPVQFHRYEDEWLLRATTVGPRPKTK